MVRSKIQASVLINRLHGHAVGKVDMSATQVAAARILLDKSVSNLVSTELTGKDGKDLPMVQIAANDNGL